MFCEHSVCFDMFAEQFVQNIQKLKLHLLCKLTSIVGIQPLL